MEEDARARSLSDLGRDPARGSGTTYSKKWMDLMLLCFAFACEPLSYSAVQCRTSNVISLSNELLHGMDSNDINLSARVDYLLHLRLL